MVAATEQVLTIAGCAERRRWRRAARVVRTTPSRLTSSTRCHSASSLSSTVAGGADAGVVHQDVDAAQGAGRVADRGGDGVVVGDVRAVAAQGLGYVAGVEVEDGDLGAALGEQPRGGQPDPRSPAGHHGLEPVEVLHPEMASCHPTIAQPGASPSVAAHLYT